MLQMNNQLDINTHKMQLLLKKREGMQNEWKQAGIHGVGMELLSHIMREHIVLVENLEFARKEQKTDLQLKVRDVQFSKLQEQIRIRDELLQNAKRRY